MLVLGTLADIYSHFDYWRDDAQGLLPSDSSLRADMRELKQGNRADAEKHKLEMEEVQRNDRKLRGAD